MRQMSAVRSYWACMALAAVVGLLGACASSPEAQLKRGYQIVGTSATATTVLLDREAITSADAYRVATVARQAKGGLDEGLKQLEACRKAQAEGQPVTCDGAQAQIQLGAGLLLELERYLQAMEDAK